MRYFVVAIILFSCSTSTPSKEQKTVSEELKEKFDRYRVLAIATTDSEGFVKQSCDSLLFTSLLYSLTDFSLIPMKAMDNTGRLWRTWRKTCLKEGRSKSTISPDNIIPWLIWAKKHDRWHELNRFIDYAESVGFKVGDHDGSADGISRVHLMRTPQVIALMYRLRENLGGNGSYWTKVPQTWDPKYSFPGHLLSLRVLLWGLMYGNIPGDAVNALRKQIEWNDRNAMFKAILFKYGHREECPYEDLFDENLFPADRLPSKSNRCTPYLWERDPGGDYEPCPGDEVHPGVDFLIAAGICLGEI